MSERAEIIKSIKAYLETDKLAGINEVLVSIRHKIYSSGQVPPRPREPVPTDGNKELLEDLKKTAWECKLCQLHKRRTNLVFGSGNADAKLMFIGEAPGADEDLQGLPFVGRAGQLLTKMIEAIGMKREDVYIANILKCRPPNNRNPLPGEIEACSPFLIKQIEIIKPIVICTLGKFASQFLLKIENPITALRGKFYDFSAYGIDGIKLMPTFHPAYLLRNPNDKRLVWEDLKNIRDELKKI